MKIWLLTGLRRREVINAEWSELPRGIRDDFIPAGPNTDEERIPVWKIPADHMKGNRAHLIPVGRPLADEFGSIASIRTSAQWVFPNQKKTGPTMRAWTQLIKETGIDDITIRDIRRSTATQ